ncbi:hypothetical protein ScPMuIL_008781 [Solemya velum]
MEVRFEYQAREESHEPKLCDHGQMDFDTQKLIGCGHICYENSRQNHSQGSELANTSHFVVARQRSGAYGMVRRWRQSVHG